MLILSGRNHGGKECTAYFDSSGNKFGSVLFVSGFVASEAQWRAFERDWVELMGEYGITAPFHATEYAHAGRDGEYAQFRDDTKRPAFEAKAIPILKRTRKPFSFGMHPADVASVAKQFELPDLLATPLVLCGMRAVTEAVQWMSRHQSGHNRVEALKVVFEDGDDDKGHFMDAVKKYTGERIAFDDKDNPRFIPGDILAWRHARLRKKDGWFEPGKHECFRGLFDQLPHDSTGVLDGQSLPEACEHLGFKRRG